MKNFTKLFFAACMITGFAFSVNAQSVGINGDGSQPNLSAGLDVNFTNKGFLPPRMTTDQIAAIASPADGLQVYNVTDGKLYIYVSASSVWKEVTFGTGTISPWVCGTSFTDARDSKVYTTLLIGTQCWMQQNLAYLPSVIGPSTGSETVSYYYVYGYNGTDVPTAKATANFQTYGVLYNWPAALTACPTGWHLPSDVEWTTLTTYLGGESVAGGKMKETGTTHWATPNTDATNSSGFAGLPGGYRNTDGAFNNRGYRGYFWSSTEYYNAGAWYRDLYYSNATVYRGSNDKGSGFSVRCLKD